mmetsp:Transcript_43873/g.129900  ORF Transcript_43873/g.129900 Transcript_43873/m.129900 type:complete len:748 (+) Transcript_43873:366-2609(+)
MLALDGLEVNAVPVVQPIHGLAERCVRIAQTCDLVLAEAPEPDDVVGALDRGRLATLPAGLRALGLVLELPDVGPQLRVPGFRLRVLQLQRGDLDALLVLEGLDLGALLAKLRAQRAQVVRELVVRGLDLAPLPLQRSDLLQAADLVCAELLQELAVGAVQVCEGDDGLLLLRLQIHDVVALLALNVLKLPEGVDQSALRGLQLPDLLVELAGQRLERPRRARGSGPGHQLLHVEGVLLRLRPQLRPALHLLLQRLCQRRVRRAQVLEVSLFVLLPGRGVLDVPAHLLGEALVHLLPGLLRLLAGGLHDAHLLDAAGAPALLGLQLLERARLLPDHAPQLLHLRVEGADRAVVRAAQALQGLRHGLPDAVHLLEALLPQASSSGELPLLDRLALRAQRDDLHVEPGVLFPQLVDLAREVLLQCLQLQRIQAALVRGPIEPALQRLDARPQRLQGRRARARGADVLRGLRRHGRALQQLLDAVAVPALLLLQLLDVLAEGGQGHEDLAAVLVRFLGQVACARAAGARARRGLPDGRRTALHLVLDLGDGPLGLRRGRLGGLQPALDLGHVVPGARSGRLGGLELALDLGHGLLQLLLHLGRGLPGLGPGGLGDLRLLSDLGRGLLDVGSGRLGGLRLTPDLADGHLLLLLLRLHFRLVVPQPVADLGELPLEARLELGQLGLQLAHARLRLGVHPVDHLAKHGVQVAHGLHAAPHALVHLRGEVLQTLVDAHREAVRDFPLLGAHVLE